MTRDTLNYTTKSCILVPAKRQMEVNAIISSVRIQLGLTLDSREELEAALLLKSKDIHPSEHTVSNLTGNMAQKIMEYAEKNKVTAVVEKNENGTYSVFSAKEDGPKINKFLFDAAWDLTGASAVSENKRMEYARTEQEEIENALKRASEKMSDAFIFSATQPDCYLHIESEGFTFYRNGIPIIQELKENNPTEYDEYLKLQAKSISSPVYMLKDEVMEKGGPLSMTIRTEVVNSLFLKDVKQENLEEVAAEKILRKFLENKYDIGTNKSIENAAMDMKYETMNDFIQYMKEKEKSDPDRTDYYEKVIRLCSNGEIHMSDAASLLERVEIKEQYIEHNPIASIEQYVETMNNEIARQPVSHTR